METIWLEDFVVLAETRSFSTAARLRHVSQPAFSRRIQALEAWVELDLLDRTSYPPSLTPAGEHFYEQARDLINRIGHLRLSSSEIPGKRQEKITFSIPHSLSLEFFPAWWANARQSVGAIEGRLRVGNVLDAVLWLVEGNCDILFCYHHVQQPVLLDPDRYEMLTLGGESLAPYCAPDDNGRPRWQWPAKPQNPAPFLAYTSNAYFSRMTDIALSQGNVRPNLKRIFDTDMSEILRRMALAGQGVAFLPESLVAEDLANRRLCKLAGEWVITMEIRAYRERASLGKPVSDHVEQLWRWMKRQNTTSTTEK